VLDDFFADAVVADGVGRGAQAGGDAGVDVHRGALGVAPAGAGGDQMISRRRPRADQLFAARRHRFVFERGPGGLARLPGEARALPAADLGRVGGEAGNHRRAHGHRGAGPAGLEARHGGERAAARPVGGLLRAAGVDGDLLVGGHRDRARPDFAAVAQQGQLVRAGRDDELLLPDEVVVELIAVPDEVVRRLAVEQDRGAVAAFNLDAAPGAGNRAAGGLQADLVRGRLPGGEGDAAHVGAVAVVVDADFVRAGRERHGAVAVADGLAVDKDVGLLGGDADLELGLLGVPAKRDERDEREDGQGKNQAMGAHGLVSSFVGPNEPPFDCAQDKRERRAVSRTKQ